MQGGEQACTERKRRNAATATNGRHASCHAYRRQRGVRERTAGKRCGLVRRSAATARGRGSARGGRAARTSSASRSHRVAASAHRSAAATSRTRHVSVAAQQPCLLPVVSQLLSGAASITVSTGKSRAQPRSTARRDVPGSAARRPYTRSRCAAQRVRARDAHGGGAGLGAEGAPPPLGAPGAHRRARGGETWRAGLRRLAARGGTHARRNGRGGQQPVHGHMCCLRFGTPLLSLMLWQAPLAYV